MWVFFNCFDTFDQNGNRKGYNKKAQTSKEKKPDANEMLVFIKRILNPWHFIFRWHLTILRSTTYAWKLLNFTDQAVLKHSSFRTYSYNTRRRIKKRGIYNLGNIHTSHIIDFLICLRSTNGLRMTATLLSYSIGDFQKQRSSFFLESYRF